MTPLEFDESIKSKSNSSNSNSTNSDSPSINLINNNSNNAAMVNIATTSTATTPKRQFLGRDESKLGLTPDSIKSFNSSSSSIIMGIEETNSKSSQSNQIVSRRLGLVVSGREEDDTISGGSIRQWSARKSNTSPSSSVLDDDNNRFDRVLGEHPDSKRSREISLGKKTNQPNSTSIKNSTLLPPLLAQSSEMNQQSSSSSPATTTTTTTAAAHHEKKILSRDDEEDASSLTLVPPVRSTSPQRRSGEIRTTTSSFNNNNNNKSSTTFINTTTTTSTAVVSTSNTASSGGSGFGGGAAGAGVGMSNNPNGNSSSRSNKLGNGDRDGDFGTTNRAGMKSEPSLVPTPIAASYSSRNAPTPPPPVPSIPSTYAPRTSLTSPTTIGTSRDPPSSSSISRAASPSFNLDIVRSQPPPNRATIPPQTNTSPKNTNGGLTRDSGSNNSLSATAATDASVSRRRSLSVGSAGAMALEYLRRSPSTTSGQSITEEQENDNRTSSTSLKNSPILLIVNGTNLKSTSSAKASSSSSAAQGEEEQRLKSELRQWQLDLDGVLGTATTAGNSNTNPPLFPGAFQYSNTNSTNLQVGDSNGGGSSGKSKSNPRRPSWNDAWSSFRKKTIDQNDDDQDKTNENENEKVGGDTLESETNRLRVASQTHRSASLPVELEAPAVPPKERGSICDEGGVSILSGDDNEGSNKGKESKFAPIALAPLIRLVSPSRGGMSQDEMRRDSTSSSISTTTTLTMTPERIENSTSAIHGLGLSSIIESHSRENSQTTPTKSVNNSNSGASTSTSSLSSVSTQQLPPPPFTISTPTTTSSSSFVNNNRSGNVYDSPSSSVDAIHQLRPSNQRNRALRTSVVSYPNIGTGNGSSTSLLNVSTNSSSYSNTRRSSTINPIGASSSSSKVDVSFKDPQELFSKSQKYAQSIWEEDEIAFPLSTKKYAEWLGNAGQLQSLTLSIWIDQFDFSNLRLDLAFRKLCEKLYLKAETQQIDRVLEQFSHEVHAMSYSLLLLNTDLHVVDSTNRMTRNQFVKNTLGVIQSQSSEEQEEDEEKQEGEVAKMGEENDVFGGKSVMKKERISHPDDGTNKIPSIIKSESSSTIQSVTKGSGGRTEALESMLKEMYTAIKAQPIFQPLSSTATSPEASRSSISLSPHSTHPNSPYSTWSNGISRTASRRSATSTMSSSSAAFKRQSLRGFGALLGASSSSADMLGGRSSPAPSTATSLSEDQFSTTAYGAAIPHHNVPTIGFANSLSHTIIREQQEDDLTSDGDVSVTDEELALLGAPWAKEGLLWRKHYWETIGKRAREKNWLHAFVVVSAGQLKMFKFDTTSGSGRGGGGGGAGMGGGDWTSNAQNVGQVSLIHALCSSMPPPGYSRERPHCFVLTLPTGGSYFFQAGTPDLVSEWVSTCNYWSARLSREPLAGGVSNMDYGWARVSLDNNDGNLDNDLEEIASIRSGRSGKSSGASRFSSTASFNLNHCDAPPIPGAVNSNDKSIVNEWKPPNQPSSPSLLSEEAQIEALKKYAEVVKKELAQHNLFRAPMIRLYSPRSTNASKALANWERKSQYLIAEIVKYQTYIDALSSAIRLRSLKRGQKEVDAMLESADVLNPSFDDEGGELPDETEIEPDYERADHHSSFMDSQTRRPLYLEEGNEDLSTTPIASTMNRSTKTSSGSIPGTAESSPSSPRFGRHRKDTPSALSLTTNGTNDDKFFDPETPTMSQHGE